MKSGFDAVITYASGPTNSDIVLSLEPGTFTLPPGETDVQLENGNIVARSGELVLLDVPREGISGLNFVGGHQGTRLAVDELGKVDGQPVRINFDGIKAAFKLLGRDQILDLTATANNRTDLQGIETLDVTGTGANTLKLSASQVREISPRTKTLTVKHDEDDTVSYGSGWAVRRPQFSDGAMMHVLLQRNAAVLVANTTPWQNPLNALDPNRDGHISPVDALIVVNTVNEVAGRALPTPTSFDTLPEFYFDTNGDGAVSPIDALLIFNFLSHVQVAAEGEGFSSSNLDGYFASKLHLDAISPVAAPNSSLHDSPISPESETAVDPNDWRTLPTLAASAAQTQPPRSATEELFSRHTSNPLEGLIDELASGITSELSPVD